MPLVLVGLAPILVAFFLLAYLKSTSMTVRPQADAMGDRKEPFLKTAVYAPYRLIAKWARGVERKVLSSVSHFAIAHFPVAAHWLHGHTARVNAQAREFAHVATDTAEALGYLRHHTMPRAINAKVAPVRTAAAHAGALAGRSISLGQRERRERTRSIDRLRKVLIPLALGFAGIDAFVRGKHAARHHADHAQTIPQIRDRDIPRLKARERAHDTELARHRTRLKRLEKALGLGILAGLVIRTLVRVAPWLFCRNWKKIGRVVCGLSPGRVDALLALLVGVFALSDLRRTARIAEDALDLVTGVVWDAAQIGDRPSGRFTID